MKVNCFFLNDFSFLLALRFILRHNLNCSGAFCPLWFMLSHSACLSEPQGTLPRAAVNRAEKSPEWGAGGQRACKSDGLATDKAPFESPLPLQAGDKLCASLSHWNLPAAGKWEVSVCQFPFDVQAITPKCRGLKQQWLTVSHDWLARRFSPCGVGWSH